MISLTAAICICAMVFQSVSLLTLKSQAEEETYTEYTLSDVGIDDGTYKSGCVKAWDVAELSHVAFTLNIQYAAGSGQPGFGFIRGSHDWSGLKFIIANESLWIQDFITNQDFSLKYNELGMESAKELTQKPMKVRTAFDRTGDELTVTVTVNDTYTKAQKLDATRFEDVRSILIYGTDNQSVTVSSTGSKDEENQPENPDIPENPGTPDTPDTPDTPNTPDTPQIPEGTYTEYTFYNLGITDGTYTEIKTPDWDVESYDKIAFTGKIQFPRGSQVNAGIVFAPNAGNWNGINLGILDNNCLYFQDFLGKHDHSVSFTEMGYKDADAFYADYVKVRLLFDTKDSNVTMTIVLNDVSVTTMTFKEKDMASLKTFVLRCALDKPVKVQSVYEGNNQKPEDPSKPQLPEGPYKEYTFYNLGLADGTYQDNKCVDWKITGYDKVAFTGKIAFSKSNLDSGFTFAPDAGNWSGLNIGIHEETIYFQNFLTKEDLNIKITDLGYQSMDDFYGKYVKMRFLFNTHKNAIRITIVLNDTHVYTMTFSEETLQTLHAFVVRATNDKPVKIQSVYEGDNKKPSIQPVVKQPKIYDTPRKQLSSYSEITLSTLKIENATVKGEAKSGMLTSLDGKVLKMKVAFPGEGLGSLTVGGNTSNVWFGVHIETMEGGLVLYEAANGAQKWIISKDTIGKDITNKMITLYLTFDVKDNHNVYLGVYVNGTFCGERYYTDLQEAFGGGVLFYSAESGMKIRSVATAWERFLQSKVNLAYFGFTSNWKSELLQRSR